MNKRFSFFSIHENAAMWIPIRLLISISIISFIAALVVFGSQISTETIQQDRFNTQLENLKHSLTSLYAHGDCRLLYQPVNSPGSTRIFQLEVPPSISSVFIGKKSLESDQLCSSIRYQTKTETELIWLNSEIKLIAGKYQKDQFIPDQNNTGFSFHQGMNCIVAELVCNQTQQFILIYPCTH
jgi:type II secretory pathway pseudopilin PulG